MASSADIVVQIDGAKRSFPFQGDETLEITPLGGTFPSKSALILAASDSDWVPVLQRVMKLEGPAAL